MYLTAVHHIHHFLFPQAHEREVDEREVEKREVEEREVERSDFHKKLMSALQRMDRKVRETVCVPHLQYNLTQTHILSYAGPASDTALGFRVNVEQT